MNKILIEVFWQILVYGVNFDVYWVSFLLEPWIPLYRPSAERKSLAIIVSILRLHIGRVQALSPVNIISLDYISRAPFNFVSAHPMTFGELSQLLLSKHNRVAFIFLSINFYGWLLIYLFLMWWVLEAAPYQVFIFSLSNVS